MCSWWLFPPSTRKIKIRGFEFKSLSRLSESLKISRIVVNLSRIVVRYLLHTVSHTCETIRPPWGAAINNMNSLYYSFIEVLIGFFNYFIAIHVSLQTIQPRVTCSPMNFQSESCLAVAYSIFFQPLVA